MNTVYRVVWNAELGQWVVASEMAKGRKKASGGRVISSAVVLGALTVVGAASAGSLDGGNASDSGTSAYGAGAVASARDATAVGMGSKATNINAVALGNQVEAAGDSSIAIAGNSVQIVAVDAASARAVAVGTSTKITSSASAVALGFSATVSGADSGVAIGSGASTTASHSVALGDASVADRANTVSVGSATNTRQIVNVGNGTQDYDAVNLSQLQATAQSAATALGGGASIDTQGIISTPNYTLTKANAITGKSGSVANVDGGMGRIDEALGVLDTRISNSTGYSGWKVQANGGTADNISAGESVNFVDGKNTTATYDATTNTMKVSVVDAPTFDGKVTAKAGIDMATTKITNLAAGTAPTDAVNAGQLKGVTDAIGGGAGINPTTGAITPPVIGVDGKNGTPATSVVDALQGLDGRVTDAIKYDSPAHDKVTFGDKTMAPVVLDNIADGAVASGSKEAVNGGQLADMQTGLTNKGMTFAGNTGTNVNRKLGDTMTIVGNASTAGDYSGANVRTLADDSSGGMTIQIAESPKFGNITINQGGNVDMGGGKIVNLADPTAAGDATNKKYVDDAIASIPGAADALKWNATNAAYDASHGGSAAPNKIINVANGTAGNDAVNVDQLQGLADAIGGGATVNPTTGEITQPTFGVDGKDGNDATSVVDALQGLDGRVGDVQNGLDGLNAEMADAIKYDSPAHDKVTFGDKTKAPVVLDNVANGKVEAGSKEAVNGGQLADMQTSLTDMGMSFAGNSGTSVTRKLGEVLKIQGGGTLADSKYASTNIKTVTDPTNGAIEIRLSESPQFGNIVVNQDGSGRIAGVTDAQKADEAVNKGQMDKAIADMAAGVNPLAVGYDTAAKDTVTLKGDDGTTITNVAAGKDGKDAVNVDQLQGLADTIGGGSTVDPTTGEITQPVFDVTDKDGNKKPATTVAEALDTLDGHITNVDGRVTNVEGDITKIINGTAGLVQQSAAGANLTVGKDTDGAAVDFMGTAGARKLINVANGLVSSTGQEAINGSQLYGTANSAATIFGGGASVDANGQLTKPEYNIAGGKYDNLNSALEAVEALAGSGSALGVVYDSDAKGRITLAGSENGGAGTLISGLKAGEQATDAVNIKQLADALGGNAIDGQGNYVGPTYQLHTNGDEVTNVHNVGDAITNLDDRVYNLYEQVETGAVGLVQQAAPGEKLTVGKDTDGTEVNFHGTVGDRKLTGVADGTIAAGSHEAINGDQLYTLSESVAEALGGHATVDKDGHYTGPTYNLHTIDGTATTVNNVGDAITNLDGRTSQNTQDIQNITNQINGSGIGLVKQDQDTREIQVASNTDGKVINVAGTEGDRTIAGVAAGKADNEAINVKQLKDAGVIDGNGNSKAVVTYDNAEKTSLTLGGTDATAPTAVHNMAAGVADNDGVNVAQLNQRLHDSGTQVLGQANSYTDSRINDVWQNLGDEINQVNRQANRGIAAASALINVTPYVPGHTAVNAGVASYRGEAALGVGVSRWSDNGRVNFNAGVSAAKNDEPVFRVGIGYVF